MMEVKNQQILNLYWELYFFLFPFLDDLCFVCEITKNMKAHYVRHINLKLKVLC